MVRRLDGHERGLALGRPTEGDPAHAHPSLPAAGADTDPLAMHALNDERLAAIEPGDHARAVARLVSEWHVAPHDAPVRSVRQVDHGKREHERERPEDGSHACSQERISKPY